MELRTFQNKAVHDLLDKIHRSIIFMGNNDQTIIQFTAPTGAGKTIMMASLFEKLLFGYEAYIPLSDAIIVWLSDSPELNIQSHNKIIDYSDVIKPKQLKIIDNVFDEETLSGGSIYFLNTQKIGENGNLNNTRGDKRRYTIWDIFRNTIRQKRNRLILVIDEAHRGASSNRLSIMQKFILGSKKDDMPAMPLVIGMSATIKRFDELVKKANSTMTMKIIVSAADVRASGLLKEKIIAQFPENPTNSEISVLQQATLDWMDKCQHWEKYFNSYCPKQHFGGIQPIFIVQVNNKITKETLEDYFVTIENTLGESFKLGEAVHSFSEQNTITLKNGYKIDYCKPSDIKDNENIRVVFFKESLSTGWDCPRAEAMMSFRHKEEQTGIAQLLGRMIRTPLHHHIDEDDSLNEVKLFLPYFDRDTVKSIVNSLKNNEGEATNVYDVEARPIDSGRLQNNVSLSTLRTNVSPSASAQLPLYTKPIQSGVVNSQSHTVQNDVNSYRVIHTSETLSIDDNQDVSNFDLQGGINPKRHQSQIEQDPASIITQECNKIIEYINNLNLKTYYYQGTRQDPPLKSWLRMVRFLCNKRYNESAIDDAYDKIVELIHNYILGLQENGTYDKMVKEVTEFKIVSMIFNIYDDVYDDALFKNVMTSAELDIHRLFEASVRKLGDEAIGYRYGKRYSDADNHDSYKIDIIGFTANETCNHNLEKLAISEFNSLQDDYRNEIKDEDRREFIKICCDGSVECVQKFTIPNKIESFQQDPTGELYYDHLLVADNTNENPNSIRLYLDGWEKEVLDEERANPEFESWLRNPERKNWALCLPSEDSKVAGKIVRFYPDFLIIRNTKRGYEVDILEPHCSDYDDNLSKAKALMKYASPSENNRISRVQLIRKGKTKNNESGFIRLDLAKSEVRDYIKTARTPQDLYDAFQKFGYIAPYAKEKK